MVVVIKKKLVVNKRGVVNKRVVNKRRKHNTPKQNTKRNTQTSPDVVVVNKQLLSLYLIALKLIQILEESGILVNKRLLSWYLIALKLNQRLEESGIQPAQSPSQSIELPLRTESIRVQKQESQPSDSIQILTKGDKPGRVEEPKTGTDCEWIISIKEKLDQGSYDNAARSWAKLCVYRIPQGLRDAGDDKAYIPQIVSLGPYHHGDERLRNMDRHKWRALHRILERNNQRIELYLGVVKKLEERARSCYEGTIGLSSNEFAEMMVLDSCFVLELLRGAAEGFDQLGYSRDDPIFGMRATMPLIQNDMRMLENQIPLFILDRLLSLQTGKPVQKGAVARLAPRFFDPLTPTDKPPSKSNRNKLESSMENASTFDPLLEHGALHCLEVFRRNLLVDPTGPTRTWIKGWSDSNCVADKRQQQIIHCVTELKKAGIKFKRRETDRFWDIKFKNGVLEIPRLLIQDGTKSLFLNLIAYEQCHLGCTSEITSYVIFMDNLIDTAEDVSYLHDHEIIENWLGDSAEVAELFNRICQEVVFDVNDSYLSRLSEQVNEYCDHKWNAWIASFKHKYFNTPWTIISLLAAAVLLVLTFAQTFYVMPKN